MYKRILSETALRIFEDAAFALVDPPDEMTEEERNAGYELHAAISFSGVYSGILAIAAPKTLGVIFAANMLGVDEDDEDAAGKSGDALGETLNMIIGNFLPAVAGAEEILEIGAPREITRSEMEETAEKYSAGKTTIVEMIADDYPVKLTLLIEKSSPDFTPG